MSETSEEVQRRTIRWMEVLWQSAEKANLKGPSFYAACLAYSKSGFAASKAAGGAIPQEVVDWLDYAMVTAAMEALGLKDLPMPDPSQHVPRPEWESP